MAESILDATAEQLRTAQAKITYLGEQSKPIATVVFFSKDYPPDLLKFQEVQNAGRSYTNDDLPYTRLVSLEPTEFRNVLQAVKPTVSLNGVAGPDFLSFTVVRTWNSKTDGQEFSIAPAHGREFFTKLAAAIDPANVEARSSINRQFSAIFP